ncbi:Ankyrin Repeat Domain-Containing Protein 11 [Manis pentadactyla]|nr:Ankyrin Repeat Domain-Containing Protein 11 [Manis pentadactyla]KAI5138039.1 Ankyrin Repeat Domain-Containing Protein 11 [Manis pentadactyla]KAI5138041.1 Ankyrin Repeat Domain-Containing Protein 11 [Manis pentadactyla]
MLGLDSSFISQDFHLVFSCLKRKNEEEEEDQRKNEEEEDNAKVLEPPSKKTRVEGFALPKDARKTSGPLCAQERLPDSESSLESKAPKGKRQHHRVREPTAQEKGPRAETVEGLVGLDTSFSSQVFHPVYSCLKRKNEEEEDKEEVLEHASKKTGVEEFALHERAPKTCSPLCAQGCLPDSASSLQSNAP